MYSSAWKSYAKISKVNAERAVVPKLISAPEHVRCGKGPKPVSAKGDHVGSTLVIQILPAAGAIKVSKFSAASLVVCGKVGRKDRLMGYSRLKKKGSLCQPISTQTVPKPILMVSKKLDGWPLRE